MKDNQHVQPVIDLTGNSVTFKVKGHLDIILDMSRLHPDIIRQAAMVGMAQVRIVDAAAVGRADKDGLIIPEAERLAMKHERMAGLVEHYMTGTAEWSRRAAGGASESGLLYRALREAYPAKTEQEIRDFLEGKSTKQKAALVASEALKPFVDKIRSESTAGINAEELLAGL